MNDLRRQNSRPQQSFERWTPRTHESPSELALQSEAKRKQAPQREANVCRRRRRMQSRKNGQHSLTSVERPSCLRSDFVNVWRHPRLVVPPVTHVSFASIVLSDLSDDLKFVSRSCLASSFIPDWLNQEDATASVWKGYFNVSPRSSLLAHQKGPFSGCYWVTSLEWPRIEWHSWRNYTNKQIKLKWTAAPFNNFFKYWREYKK